jgi:hypothetical protein
MLLLKIQIFFDKVILQWDEQRSYLFPYILLQTATENIIAVIALPVHYTHTSECV